MNDELPSEIEQVLSTVQDHREDGEKVAAFFNALRANIKNDEDSRIALALATSWIYRMFGEEEEDEEV